MIASSSRIKSFSFICPPQFEIQRDRDNELGAYPYLALNGDGAAQILYDSVRNRQTQTGALTDCFGGKERIENLASHAFGDPRAGVANRNQESPGSLAGSNENGSFPGDGVDGVGNQIHQDLLEPARIAGQHASGDITFFHADAAVH